MIRSFLGRLGFVHRHLWRQDGFYRAAVLFGPAPLLGAAIATAAWHGMQRLQSGPGAPPVAATPPGWAIPVGPPRWASSGSPPVAVSPGRELPASDAAGVPIGYQPGWRGTINPASIDQTLNVDVTRTVLATFAVAASGPDMAQVQAEAPKTPLAVAVGSGFLVVRTAGVYALSAMLERPSGQAADCLARLAVGPRRVFSNLEITRGTAIAKTFDPVRFDLQPGLYPVGWAFGCWQGPAITGSGRLTILIGHPGEASPMPARAGDIVRPVTPP